MLERKRLEALVLEKLKTVPEKPAKVSFVHKQNYWIGDENLTGGKILVFVGPSPSPRWEREGMRVKRRTMFVSVRISSACNQDEIKRVEKLIDFSEQLLNHVTCMRILDGEYAAYSVSAEFDPMSDPLNYDYLAGNRFFSSFTLEFRDQQLFDMDDEQTDGDDDDDESLPDGQDLLNALGEKLTAENHLPLPASLPDGQDLLNTLGEKLTAENHLPLPASSPVGQDLLNALGEKLAQEV